ncbi:MAG: hypothetical protein HYU56_02720 [Candidatus Aenigmarchaeota archaeon]|nr:hypothetical protein [Candidatus Aenigmarchaeota archaeon]
MTKYLISVNEEKLRKNPPKHVDTNWKDFAFIMTYGEEAALPEVVVAACRELSEIGYKLEADMGGRLLTDKPLDAYARYLFECAGMRFEIPVRIEEIAETH